MFERAERGDRAVILHPVFKLTGPEALDEFQELARSAGAEVVGIVTAPRDRPDARFFVGSGKIEELEDLVRETGADLVLVSQSLSAVQERNIEKACKARVLDRSTLILDIFAQRAQSYEGKLQVELAQLRHLSTRLVRGWTHLERQKGGIGLRGPGETQLETDRRLVGVRIRQLNARLGKVARQREQSRRQRKRSRAPLVALVGYTNAGKSTLFNRLTGADVFAKDMLFATLDPTMRKIALPTGDEIIMSDTVGFISNLPTELVAAFRATLEEVLDADLIVHVRDISHPQTDDQAQDVATILKSLGVAETAPLIEVWNKIDQLDEDSRAPVLARAARNDDVFATSAVTGEGMGDLLAAIAAKLQDPRQEEVLTLGFDAMRKRAWLFDAGVVIEETQTDDGYVIKVLWTALQKERFVRL